MIFSVLIYLIMGLRGSGDASANARVQCGVIFVMMVSLTGSET